jgi:hypothetical protein
VRRRRRSHTPQANDVLPAARIATDGTPRVLATWFHWTGKVLTMPTFLAAPHVRHAPGRLRALRANPNVAVTIDTETFPPEVLTLRGSVEISAVDGVPPEYAAAARRYLGEEAGQRVSRADRPTGNADGQDRPSPKLGRRARLPVTASERAGWHRMRKRRVTRTVA